MKIDKTYLQDIVEKYGLAAVAEEMERRLDIPTAKLGFIGAFSSGKSSLLNALLDTKRLPVDIKPTTKSICIVEPVADLESPRYFRDTDEGREEIDFMTFTDIVNGDSFGDAAIQLPLTGTACDGMVFIDTPGVDSMGRDEAERTYSYLALMDAAVVCIPVEDGTLKKSVADFITSPLLKPLGGNLVFVLTKADQKAPNAVETIREEIVRQLENLCAEDKLRVHNVAERVVAVSMENAKEVLLPFLQKHCFAHLPALVAAREQKELKALAADVAGILKARADSLTFDASQYEEAIAKAQRDRECLEEEIAQKKELFSTLEEELQQRLGETMSVHKLAIDSATGDEMRREAIDRMNEDVRSVAEMFARQHVASFTPGPGISGVLGAAVEQAMKNVDRVRDMTVMTATAIATAWIAPGATAAANAGEAAGGAITQQAAKQVAANAGKAAAQQAAKRAAMGKFLCEVGQFIKAINPLETVGDIVAEKVKAARFDDLARSASRRIAAQVISDLATPYQREVIAPLRLRLEEIERGLSAQRTARHEAADKLREEHQKMKAIISELIDFADKPA